MKKIIFPFLTMILLFGACNSIPGRLEYEKTVAKAGEGLDYNHPYNYEKDIVYYSVKLVNTSSSKKLKFTIEKKIKEYPIDYSVRGLSSPDKSQKKEYEKTVFEVLEPGEKVSLGYSDYGTYDSGNGTYYEVKYKIVGAREIDKLDLD